MKTYGLILAAAILLLPLDPAAVPQQTPPSASNQASSGPSLAITMQFIQDKMNDIDKVSFVTLDKNIIDGNSGSNSFTIEISNAVADPNQCRISLHWKATKNSAIVSDMDAWFSLRDVQDIVAEPYAQYQTEENASLGLPNWIVTSTNPPLTALLVRRPHGLINLFAFTDPQLANRFAKAMVHAVQLCGGGSKDPF